MRVRWILILVGFASACVGGTHMSPMPVSEGYLTGADGNRIYFRAVGAGADTVVYVNGSAGHMNTSLADLEPLPRGRTVLFYDQRGAGRSELVPDTLLLTVDRYVADLEALRRHFGLETMMLMGHSWGAQLAGLYAMAHPDRIERLILWGPPGTTPAHAQEASATLIARLDSASLARVRTLSREWAAAEDPVAVCREFYTLFLPTYVADPISLQQMRGDFCDAPVEAIRVQPLRSRIRDRSLGTAYDYRPALARVTAPTLVIHGAEDFIPVESSREWAAALPDARLLVIPGAGHGPHFERPDIFFPKVDQFLRGSWPEGAEAIARRRRQ